MHLFGEGDAGAALTKGGHEVGGVGGLGLDIVGQPVGVVAGEVLAARHGTGLVDGPHLLDVAVVRGVDDGGDVEEGQAAKAAKGNLAEHAGLVLLALLDGVEVAAVDIGEGDGGVLLVADSDGLSLGRTRAGREVDGTLNVVEGPEGDGSGVDSGGRGSEAEESLGEMHFDWFLVCKKVLSRKFVRIVGDRRDLLVCI